MTNDFIEIKGLEIYSFIGVFPEEKKLGQKFYVDAKIYLDMQNAGMTDDLEKSVNYADIVEIIKKAFSVEKADLIERVAELSAQSILGNFKSVNKVTIKVSKPSAPVLAHFEDVSVCITRARHTAYIGMGSNMGDMEVHLANALNGMKQCSTINIKKISSFYTTKPVGYLNQPDFLNAVVKIETTCEPEHLLDILQSIELAEGRERKIHWGPRTLDLDILLFDDMIINTERLKVPHPEMNKREFVIVPLAEIAPYALNPLTREYITDIKEKLCRLSQQ